MRAQVDSLGCGKDPNGWGEMMQQAVEEAGRSSFDNSRRLEEVLDALQDLRAELRAGSRGKLLGEVASALARMCGMLVEEAVRVLCRGNPRKPGEQDRACKALMCSAGEIQRLLGLIEVAVLTD